MINYLFAAEFFFLTSDFWHLTSWPKIVEFSANFWYNAPAFMMIHSTIKKAYMPETPPHKNPQKSARFNIKNMQNEPNLNNWTFPINPLSKAHYTPLDTWCDEKNEPNTNPKRTQFKPNSNPKTTNTKSIISVIVKGPAKTPFFPLSPPPLSAIIKSIQKPRRGFLWKPQPSWH